MLDFITPEALIRAGLWTIVVIGAYAYARYSQRRDAIKDHGFIHRGADYIVIPEDDDGPAEPKPARKDSVPNGDSMWDVLS